MWSRTAIHTTPLPPPNGERGRCAARPPPAPAPPAPPFSPWNFPNFPPSVHGRPLVRFFSTSALVRTAPHAIHALCPFGCSQPAACYLLSVATDPPALFLPPCALPVLVFVPTSSSVATRIHIPTPLGPPRLAATDPLAPYHSSCVLLPRRPRESPPCWLPSPNRPEDCPPSPSPVQLRSAVGTHPFCFLYRPAPAIPVPPTSLSGVCRWLCCGVNPWHWHRAHGAARRSPAARGRRPCTLHSASPAVPHV